MKRLLLAACLIVSTATPGLSQTDNPAWLDELRAELARTEQCEVAFFVRVQEDVLGGRTIYVARAQCVDGRQFDASRKEGEPDFAIEACAVAVC